MTAASPGRALDPAIAAPMRVGMGRNAYGTMIGRLADTLARDDGQDPATLPPHQREADREAAEWLIERLHAAGYVPRRRQPGPTR